MKKMKISFHRRSSKAFLCITFLLSCFVLFNFTSDHASNLIKSQRALSSSSSSSSSSFTYRYLSKNLGDGRCEWTPPEFLRNLNTFNTTTVIASYPGSGKRLVWRIIEALTGTFVNGLDRKVDADDPPMYLYVSYLENLFPLKLILAPLSLLCIQAKEQVTTGIFPEMALIESSPSKHPTLIPTVHGIGPTSWIKWSSSSAIHVTPFHPITT